MKNGKILILLLTAVLLLLAAEIGYMEPAQPPDTEVKIPLTVTAMLDGQQERITCWEDEAGEYLIFLPSGVKMSDVTISLEKGVQAVLDQKPLEDGGACGDFQQDTPYLLRCTTNGITTEHILTFLQSAELPSFHLDVQSGSMALIHETKGNQESGSARLYSQTGQLLYSGQMESLRGRGNSSWNMDKKPYSLTLAREADLLGMGQAKNWILLSNAKDSSHLRNKVVYDLAARVGMAYTPECKWVDLYLNGEYAGVYLLSERNEIHPQRVNLQITGSFLVSRESRWRLSSQQYPHILTDSRAALRIHDSGLTQEDLYRIWQPVENAILSEDGRDPLSGKSWQELIDMDSWAMEYLMGEIFGNVDAGSISQYYYRDGQDPSGRIYAGPVWDYDLSMGNEAAWSLKYVKAFYADKKHLWNLEDTTWYYGLNQKPEFQMRVRELYEAVYRPLVMELLDTGLDAYAAQVEQGAILDQRRWETGNAGEETENIRRYLTERIAFLDSVWLENRLYYKVLVVLNNGANTSVCHAVSPGEKAPPLPGYESSWEILGWYDADTEEPFDSEQPIERDTIVYLKKLPSDEDRISPLQVVPMVGMLLILPVVIQVDQKRRRAQKTNGKKPIVKQKIV